MFGGNINITAMRSQRHEVADALGSGPSVSVAFGDRLWDGAMSRKTAAARQSMSSRILKSMVRIRSDYFE